MFLNNVLTDICVQVCYQARLVASAIFATFYHRFIDSLLECCQEHIKNEGAQLPQFARLDVPFLGRMPN